MKDDARTNQFVIMHRVLAVIYHIDIKVNVYSGHMNEFFVTKSWIKALFVGPDLQYHCC